MPKRYYIHMGDATTANGVVTEGLSSNTWHGHPNSYEGDKIDCPTCHSTGVIKCAGSRISNKGTHGKEAALDGDLCICKCPEPPRLIASQSVYSTEGEATPSVVDFGNYEKNAAIGNPGNQYDQHFVIFDSASQRPAMGIAYSVKSAAGEHHGTVNTEGKTVGAYSPEPQEVGLKYLIQTQFGVDKR